MSKKTKLILSLRGPERRKKNEGREAVGPARKRHIGVYLLLAGTLLCAGIVYFNHSQTRPSDVRSAEALTEASQTSPPSNPVLTTRAKDLLARLLGRNRDAADGPGGNFRLMGLIVSPTRSLAMINNTSLHEHESGNVRTDGLRLEVVCLEINSERVLIQSEGRAPVALRMNLASR